MRSLLSLWRVGGRAPVGRRAAGRAGPDAKGGGRRPAAEVGPRRAGVRGCRSCRARDADKAVRLQETVDRLNAVATKADGWRQALLRSARQDPLTGLANRSRLLNTGRAAFAVRGSGAVRGRRPVEGGQRPRRAGGRGPAARSALRPAAPARGAGNCRGPGSAAWVAMNLWRALPGMNTAAAEAIGHGLAAALVDEVEVGRRTVRVWAPLGAGDGCARDAAGQGHLAGRPSDVGAKERGRGLLLHLVGSDVRLL